MKHVFALDIKLQMVIQENSDICECRNTRNAGDELYQVALHGKLQNA